MDLNKLNKLGVGKTLKKIGDLECNKEYKITSARVVKTKYGRRVIVKINDFDVFLPARYQEISDEDVNKLKNCRIINRTTPSDTFTKIEFTE